MSDIRYVVLSDLHFGEVNSVLTDVVPYQGGPPRVNVPRLAEALADLRTPADLEIPVRLEVNDLARALVDSLHTLVAANENGTKPTIVLNGDIFELALAPRSRAFDVFDQFIKLLMPTADHGFDDTIIYLPGNHDHDLWDTVRDEIDIHLIETHDPDDPVPGAVPITDMFGHLDEEHPMLDDPAVGEVRSRLLTRLIHHRNPHLRDVQVRVSYPNLGLVNDEHLVVIHHGHFVEETYTLMTHLAHRVFDHSKDDTTTWDLEIDNGAWLNFVWSSLGREGPVGDSIRRSYDLVHTEIGRVLISERLAAALSGPRRRNGKGRVRRWALRALILRVITHLKDIELRYDSPLKPAVDAGLVEYLEGPVARHLRYELAMREMPEPTELTFIFGHTHQPFTSLRPLESLHVPLRLYNTGGWVVDTFEHREKKGAGIVLLDDDLEAVLVRFFQQSESLGTEMAVEHSHGPDADSPFFHRISGLVDSRSEPWSTLLTEAAAAVGRRRASHRDRLEREIAELTASDRFHLEAERLLQQANDVQRGLRRRLARVKNWVS